MATFKLYRTAIKSFIGHQSFQGDAIDANSVKFSIKIVGLNINQYICPIDKSIFQTIKIANMNYTKKNSVYATLFTVIISILAVSCDPNNSRLVHGYDIYAL